MIVLANLSVSRFNHIMENMPDKQHVQDIERLGWLIERENKEQALLRRAADLEAKLDGCEFNDDDEQYSFLHDALREINDDNPYIGREGRVTGVCGVPFQDPEGRPRVWGIEVKGTAFTNLGLTVLPYVIDNAPSQTEYYIGHWLEYVSGDDGERHTIVAQLSDEAPVNMTYDENVVDYMASLRSVLPRDMMDMFERITTVYSDDQLSEAVQLLARMRIDTRHIAGETMTDLANYVMARLGIRQDVPHMMVVGETLTDEAGNEQFVVDTDAVMIERLVIEQAYGVHTGSWHMEVQYLTGENTLMTGARPSIPLASIQALHPLWDDVAV